MDDDALANHWLASIDLPQVRAGLEGAYAAAAEEIEHRGPACWASGRCCNFEKTGHRLYVTGLEAAYTIRMLPTVGDTPPALTAGALDGALRRGGCPFQAANLCAVHAIKPLGCRVYFCDRSAQDWQQDLSERLLLQIRDLHGAHRVEYHYGEWRRMLGMFVGADAPARP